ncbi:MAG: 5-formyltetrahydrofolate cyclo-ligase [Bacteroidetes bacterium]|nr:5-formyltetrahydrofolate cyclo-ligase [Bacteroidota bacterium]
MTTKEVLRAQMKEQRASLSKTEVRERSKQILENLLSLPDFFRHDTVHTYVSSKNNEADTHELIRVLVKQRKRVVVPVSDAKTKLMRHSELFSLGELIGGAYGILEPRMVRPVPVADLQVIVVPAMAVDRQGNRLGFGAGFYDRFLHDVQLPTIALAYDFQVVERVPTESTDIPVSYIVTEQEIIRCVTN